MNWLNYEVHWHLGTTKERMRRFEEGTLQEGESEINPEDEILDTRPPSPETYYVEYA